MTGQPKSHSMIETLVNVGTGYFLALIISSIAFPLMGWDSTFSERAGLSAVYTIASIIRGYIFRRIFNWYYVNHYIKKNTLDIKD